MAIAYDVATTGGTTDPGTSLTWAHTCTGSDLILFVYVRTQAGSGADVVSGVTYNAVAMTRVNTVRIDDTTARLYLYYLVNPASGANNVVVSTGSSVVIKGFSASYTGAKQTGQPDSNNTNSQSTGAGITTSTTTVADNCWLVGIANEPNGDGSGHTAGANTTLRINTDRFGIMDSNAAKTPAGSYSLAYAWTNNAKAGACIASFSPAVAAGPANLKSLDTNVKANIKSYNTNLIANVKSINTNA